MVEQFSSPAFLMLSVFFIKEIALFIECIHLYRRFKLPKNSGITPSEFHEHVKIRAGGEGWENGEQIDHPGSQVEPASMQHCHGFISRHLHRHPTEKQRQGPHTQRLGQKSRDRDVKAWASIAKEWGLCTAVGV